ncbi:uncharacterized protein [Chelonus insularis]|uniref:uncharacterized protein n=1 Tax=Chelonus insularis TaxID=460826 RepID=UPI00158D3CAE|nr:uncharacterized protein LOC118068399 [Chelonus insularis]XP_034941660.1 uncharacterized protein LOC118068399 [Chelonus insularis]
MYECIALLFVFLGLFNNLQSTKLNGTELSLPFGPKAKLSIEPPFMAGIENKVIIKKTNESLNLTCTVVQQNGEKNDTLFDYTVDWKLPSLNDNFTSNFNRGNYKNMAWLWFDRLSERDSGNYTCHAVTSEGIRQPHISVNIFLSVKSVKTMPSFCGSQWFKCRSTNCIMARYVCDGKKDCEEGEDESAAAGCESDPCFGKIFCGERCIPPEWCCDYRNCSTTYGLRPWPPETHEISYVQTAFYTVIGCAMAFMFIVTILVIAICRVQIKRAMNSRWNQRSRDIYRRQPRSVSLNMPIYDVDVYLNRAADNYPPGVNIMYNINSGVQFVGQPVEPPPYSEVIVTPPREGPPPPYVSCENLVDRTTISRMITDASHTCENIIMPPIPNFHSVQGPLDILNPQDISYNHHLARTSDISSTQILESSTSTTIVARDEPDLSLRPYASQAFDLEYVETDALLSENSKNDKIQNSKDIISKSNIRQKVVKSKRLPQEFSNKANDRTRISCQTDEDSSNLLVVQGKELPSRDVENEGIFLETDQQNACSTSTIISSQTNSSILSSTKSLNNLKPGPSSFKNKGNENIELPTHNIIPKPRDEVKSYPKTSDNICHDKNSSLHPSQAQNSENLKRGNTLIYDNEQSNKSNESSNMSTSVVASDNVRDVDNDSNNELQASEPLILPLRESFIGVQKGN